MSGQIGYLICVVAYNSSSIKELPCGGKFLYGINFHRFTGRLTIVKAGCTMNTTSLNRSKSIVGQWC